MRIGTLIWAVPGVAMMMTQAFAQEQPPFAPQGELAKRIEMTLERMEKTIEPAFTDDFILADVKLDPAYPRRFSDFSGDLSGRVIGALSMMSRGGEDDVRLKRLVSEALKYQRADGRFGKEDLSFEAQDVGPDQMALLWGNGRMLVGLLEYYQRFKEQPVLDASVRLGDFLLKVFDACSKPDVIERLRGKAANGFICFTQFNEGLELLTRATGDEKYRKVALKMEPLLEPRGDQHTHGYLTTLRGHLMIFESTGDTAILESVMKRYLDLFEGGSVLTNGGVLEYFKPGYDRDEGCSEADFLRLSLQLWRATGEMVYLEKAERCLYNIFYANQFDTGDFGHHAYDGRGYVTVPGPGRAWWCCTMHGLRAFRDVIDCAVTRNPESGEVDVNLWLEGTWTSPDLKFRLERAGTFNGAQANGAFRMTFDTAPEKPLKTVFRAPYWAVGPNYLLIKDGKEAGGSGSAYKPGEETPAAKFRPINVTTENTFKSGDAIDLQLHCVFQFIGRDGKTVAYDQISAEKPQELAVFYGPWLMGVDATRDPMFHGEPFGENVIQLPLLADLYKSVLQDSAPETPLLSNPRLAFTYKHDGFTDLCNACLRPTSELTTHPQSTFSFWHKFKRIQ